MLRRILLAATLALAVAGLAASPADAHSGTCTTTLGPRVPQVHVHGIGPSEFYDSTPAQFVLSENCTNGTARITAVSVLSQLFIGGTTLYDNGYGYQTVDAQDTHANSFNVTSLVPASTPYDYHGAALCDKGNHWYGQRWFFKVYWSNGTSTDILHTIDSGGLLAAC